MIVGFLALRFPGKTSVLCVIDISLCAYGCDHGLNCFRKSNSRSDSVFNKWWKLLDQENHKNTLICIEISTWYQSHGGHGATKVRCEHNCILAGPVSSRVLTLVMKTSDVFKKRNSSTLDKGRVQTSLEFLQANTLAGCELPSGFS